MLVAAARSKRIARPSSAPSSCRTTESSHTYSPAIRLNSQPGGRFSPSSVGGVRSYAASKYSSQGTSEVSGRPAGSTSDSQSHSILRCPLPSRPVRPANRYPSKMPLASHIVLARIHSFKYHPNRWSHRRLQACGAAAARRGADPTGSTAVGVSRR